MKNQTIKKYVPTALLCSLYFGLIPLSQAAAERPPNIVLILIDDMPWYGTDVRMDPDLPGSAMAFRNMPNVQMLAKQGMTFQNAYSGAGMCAPSRCCLQTGMTAARHLYSGNGGFGPMTDGTVEYKTKKADAKRPVLCPEPQGNIRFPSIGDVLKAGGYTTAHIGKWHLYGGGPEKHGYDVSDGETDNKTFRPAKDPKTGKNADTDADPKFMFSITERGIDFMESAVKARKPFFLQLSHYATHAFYQARPETLAKVENDPLFKHLKPREKKDAVIGAAMCADLDTTIGMVLKKIDQLGIAKNTYVVFVSDNGYHSWNEDMETLRGAKWWLWEAGIRVPMIVRGPSIPAGSRCDVNVVNYDFLPTFADLAGASTHVPKEVDGTSFKTLLFGKPVLASYENRPLFFHYPHYRVAPPSSAIIAGNWKLLHFYEWPDQELLFNLTDDLGEQSNLAAVQPERSSQMVKQLMSQIKTVGGYFPKPNPDADPNAKVYDPNKLADKGDAGDPD
ncbi:sulfatase [Pontiella sulfatireligans]|uniref:Arylsulfatase n=1 Tax=Pontiella sulfatireligans TaxID=2750658 RepID=A0A6C2UTN6_9BACT|nr:sulfatase [Pontiella sulfatireligans]SPS74580.1 sulfatase S1_16 [Kiritimatiellales bacterium]VGO23529.1 Arylsulfatase [Pontiella sulfatireligans]